MEMIQIDMPMPKCCDECFALDDHGDYPLCLISQDQRGYKFNTRQNRMPSCPLKPQEPIRPIINKDISSGECEDPWGRLFFCGACGKRINEKYNPDEDDKYCKHCGRAIKWE